MPSVSSPPAKNDGHSVASFFARIYGIIQPLKPHLSQHMITEDEAAPPLSPLPSSSQAPPPSKKHKSGEERKETFLLKEKPLLPLMDDAEVESTLHLEVMDIEETSQLKGLEELPRIPFVDRYKIGKYYYKRKCYDEYYKLVKDMLDNKKECVAVTGTPGIGMSIFYGYFFQRFWKETKGNNMWIIAAAYIGGELNAAMGYKDNDNDTKEILSDGEITDFIRAAWKKKKNVILLCDGSPKRTWGWTQMVAFTSPNKRWMRAGRKHDCTLYIPLWTLTELQEDAEMLGLHRTDGDESYITAEIIAERFYTFGGVAHECFLLTEREIFMERQQLMAEIATISDLGKPEGLIIGQENTTCHRVLHLVPVSGDMESTMATTQLASPFVKKILAERLATTSKADWERLRKSLEGLLVGAAMSKWLSEIGGYETLGRGCTLQLRVVPSQEPASGIAMDASTAE